MKYRTQVSGLPFFIFWLCFSCFLTYVFAVGITKDIATKGTSPWMYLVLILPVCFVLIGIWGLVSSLRGGLDADSGGRFQAKTEIPAGGRIGVILFGLPFFLCGVCVMIFFSIVPVIKTINARHWDRVTAEVIHSDIKTNHDSDGNTYKPDVQFRYSYDGVTYVSKTYDFVNMSTGGYKSVRRKVDSVPVGSRPQAYVNPHHPQEAVLSVKLTWFYLFTFMFGAIFALVGGFLIAGAAGLLEKIKRKNVSTQIPEHSGGAAKLKSRGGGPFARFIIIVVVSGIWNGAVYLLFTRGAPFFFKLIFGGVGLGLIVAVGYSFLALFNPRLEVETDARYVRLGESFRLKWRIKGKNNRSIRKFTVSLNGQEEATYRRGTSTYTDRHIFFTRVIADQEGGNPEDAGAQSVSVPSDTMYSWKSSNNKIVWFLKFNGVIDNWPDITEEYEITLLPLKG